MTASEAIELINKIAFSVENEIEEIKASKFITAIKMAKEALEKQIPKKLKHIHEKYENHQWKRDEDGNIDEWAFNHECHNGVVCVRCHKSTCVQCEPDYDKGPCIVDKELCPTCGKEVYRYRKRNYCEDCGQALDWSETE